MNPIREEKDRIRDSYLEKRKSMSEEERLRREQRRNERLKLYYEKGTF